MVPLDFPFFPETKSQTLLRFATQDRYEEKYLKGIETIKRKWCQDSIIMIVLSSPQVARGNVSYGGIVGVSLWHLRSARVSTRCYLWCTRTGRMPERANDTDRADPDMVSKLVCFCSASRWSMLKLLLLVLVLSWSFPWIFLKRTTPKRNCFFLKKFFSSSIRAR